MEEMIDPYCPFCRTEGTVVLFATRTSVYDTLYRCGLCYKVFDEKERGMQEEKNRQRRPTKGEEKSPTSKKSRKKMVLFLACAICVLAGIGSVYFP